MPDQWGWAADSRDRPSKETAKGMQGLFAGRASRNVKYPSQLIKQILQTWSQDVAIVTARPELRCALDSERGVWR